MSIDPLAMIPSPQPRKPKRRRAKWTVRVARSQSILHLLIASPIIWLGVTFLGEIMEYYQADMSSPSPPINMGYWLPVGLLFGLLIASLAFGLWNRRTWALLIATAFYAIIAITALGSSLLMLLLEALLIGNSPTGTLSTETSRPLHNIAGLSFCICIVAGSFFLWFCRFLNAER